MIEPVYTNESQEGRGGEREGDISIVGVHEQV